MVSFLNYSSHKAEIKFSWKIHSKGFDSALCSELVKWTIAQGTIAPRIVTYLYIYTYICILYAVCIACIYTSFLSILLIYICLCSVLPQSWYVQDCHKKGPFGRRCSRINNYAMAIVVWTRPMHLTTFLQNHDKVGSLIMQSNHRECINDWFWFKSNLVW